MAVQTIAYDSGSDSATETIYLNGTGPAYNFFQDSMDYADGLAEGRTVGRGRGINIGKKIGLAEGEEQGFDQGRASGFSVGLALRGGAILDFTNPTVTITSLPVGEEDPAIVTVYDASALRLVQLVCQDRSDGPKLIVYDDTGFQHPFGGRSTVTGSGTQADPYIFTVYRRGRWPTGASLAFGARAIDTSGNQGSAS